MAVFRGETPDVVPWYADLSHWYQVERGERVPLAGRDTRDTEMVALHKRVGAGLYLNMGCFHRVEYDTDEVNESIGVEGDIFRHTIQTPLGTVYEERRWSYVSFSWDIIHRMLQSVEDFPVVEFAMKHRQYVPAPESYYEWEADLDGIGIPFDSTGFSGLGFLISRYMGLENSIYAIHDHPDDVQRFIDTVNESALRRIDAMCASPSPVIFFTDNLDAFMQSPNLFRRYSADFYTEMARRAHAAGKYVSVHVDGRMGGLLPILAECKIDIIDAMTPAPMGDLTPQECRDAAGPDTILWGGIPPTTWEPRTSDAEFRETVKRWLDLRLQSPRLVLAPGDQVPPGTEYRRIVEVAELVEEYGRY